MKKIRNKFIYFVILLIAAIVASTFLKPLIFAKKPESAVILVQGKGTLNAQVLEIDERKILHTGDIIETIGAQSLAVIEWGDGSLTRMGGDTKIEVTNNLIASDKSKIQIAFQLFSGKTWSNVISFLGEESYFKQSFRDNEASVRGTVFNIDLDNEYIYVTDHKIDLTTSVGKVYQLQANKPFSLKTFSFIELSEFIMKIKDKAWEDLNKQFDKQYLQKLQNALIEQIKEDPGLEKLKSTYEKLNAGKLSIDEKRLAYDQLLEKYQEFNFVDMDNIDLFERKQELREMMLEFASEQNKENLLSNIMNDFQQSLKSQDLQAIKIMSPALLVHQDIVSKMNISLERSLDLIPEDLRAVFGKNFEEVKEIFEGQNPIDKMKSVDPNAIKQGLDTVKDAANQEIHNKLDSLKDTLFNK